MDYIVSANTDIGSSRPSNQDSLCIKCAKWDDISVVMIIVCDGMGGLSKGELASATVVRAYDQWFEKILPDLLPTHDCKELSRIWVQYLLEIGEKIRHYGIANGKSLGTTFSGMLIIDDKYFCVHVGDSRIYKISDSVLQLTEDHTYVAREIAAGRLTAQEAAYHPKRNTLLQCVGASKRITPQVFYGKIQKGDRYLFCSDGFRHKLNEQEIAEAFTVTRTSNSKKIRETCESLTASVIKRGEKDNISAAFIRAL